MPLLELPHTTNCLVCGQSNPHGLHLHLFVDPQTSQVQTQFTPTPDHIGFEGIAHGGILATILDEAMVWAATWQGARFCVCGELTVRFKQIARVGVPLLVQAKVATARSRLIEVEGTITDDLGMLIAIASAKYVPVPPERHREFVATLVDDIATQETARRLCESADA